MFEKKRDRDDRMNEQDDERTPEMEDQDSNPNDRNNPRGEKGEFEGAGIGERSSQNPPRKKK